MKKHSNRQFAKALYEVTEGLPKNDIPEVIRNFLMMLQKNNKLKKIEHIMEEFIQYSKKQAGIQDIEIESARKLDQPTLDKIKKLFGEKSEISEKINKDLLGGVKIKIDDLVYDASLQKQLIKLKEKLIS